MLGNQQYLAGERYNKNMKGLFLEGNKKDWFPGSRQSMCIHCFLTYYSLEMCEGSALSKEGSQSLRPR